MYNEITGNMLKLAPQGDIIAIPVNTVGVAGRGLALYMRNHFPETYQRYTRACRKGTIDKGELLVTCENNWWIAAIPTKYRWQNPSVPELIDESLQRLKDYMEKHALAVCHLPELGCGKATGQLSYERDVRPLIEKHFGQSDLVANVYRFS